MPNTVFRCAKHIPVFTEDDVDLSSRYEIKEASSCLKSNEAKQECAYCYHMLKRYK